LLLVLWLGRRGFAAENAVEIVVEERMDSWKRSEEVAGSSVDFDHIRMIAAEGWQDREVERPGGMVSTCFGTWQLADVVAEQREGWEDSLDSCACSVSWMRMLVHLRLAGLGRLGLVELVVSRELRLVVAVELREQESDWWI
jgi:hypothetical protein